MVKSGDEQSYQLRVVIESMIGIFVFKLLEELRKAFCTLLKPIIP